MGNYELQIDEVVLYEGIVRSSTFKGSVRLTLTSKRMIFEKEKGLFKKELEVIDVILLENIKIYNNAVQVKQKGAEVEIQKIQKNISLMFSGMIEAKKFCGKIVDASTGTTIVERSSNKIKNAFSIVDDTLGLDTRGTMKGLIENGVKGTIINGIKKKK